MKNKKNHIKVISKVSIILICIIILLFGSYKIFKKYRKIELLNILKVQPKNEQEDKKKNIIASQKFAHISIDDFIESFKDITVNQNEYESIFENEVFQKLQYLHKEYGVVISCYTYYEDGNRFNLSMCTDKFANEFKENSEWLKFGFHTKNPNRDYEILPSFVIKYDYDKVIEELLRITGTEECIDKVIRLQSFKGNINSIVAIKETKYGIEGLLGADDTRRSYYLSDESNSYLYLYDYMEDENNIKYFRTDIRIENITDIDKLIEKISDPHINNTDQILIIFTHEWELMGEYKNERYNNMEELSRAIKINGYVFDYPMERIKNIKE